MMDNCDISMVYISKNWKCLVKNWIPFKTYSLIYSITYTDDSQLLEATKNDDIHWTGSK